MRKVRPLFETVRTKASRAQVLSLLLSCGILFGGMFWTWRIGNQANNLDHQLYHAREGVESLRHYVSSGKAGAP